MPKRKQQVMNDLSSILGYDGPNILGDLQANDDSESSSSESFEAEQRQIPKKNQQVPHPSTSRTKTPNKRKGTPKRREVSKSNVQSSATRRRKRRPQVLNEIKRLQRGTDLLLRKAPFSRLVREIANKVVVEEFPNNHDGFRWNQTALLCLQEASEHYLINVLENCNILAGHAKRVTIMCNDMNCLRLLKLIDGC